MKNKKYIVLGMITCILVLFILFSNHINIYKYKEITYCDSYDMCYKYDGMFLDYYEYDSNSDGFIFYDKVFYNSIVLKMKKMKVLLWDNDKLVMKKDDTICHYVNKNSDGLVKTVEKDFSGKAFKNEDLEFYFYKDFVIVGRGHNQRRGRYHFLDYGDEYLDFLITDIVKYPENDSFSTYGSFTFNTKNNEFIGLKSIDKEELNTIDFKYYDDEGNIKDEYKIDVNGFYKSESLELMIYNDKLFEVKENYGYYHEFFFREVTDKYNMYSDSIMGPAKYYYDKENKKFCQIADAICFDKVSKEQLSYVNYSYYNNDLSINGSISIDGVYKYSEYGTEAELMIRDNQGHYKESYKDNRVDKDVLFIPVLVTYNYIVFDCSQDGHKDFLNYNFKDNTIDYYGHRLKKVS